MNLKNKESKKKKQRTSFENVKTNIKYLEKYWNKSLLSIKYDYLMLYIYIYNITLLYGKEWQSKNWISKNWLIRLLKHFLKNSAFFMNKSTFSMQKSSLFENNRYFQKEIGIFRTEKRQISRLVKSVFFLCFGDLLKTCGTL